MTSVLISVDAGLQTITLNRPDKLNAFNPEMHKALRAAPDQARDERSIRALLLTGAGRGFCSGQDLSERRVDPGAAPIDLSVSLGSYYNPLVRRLRELPKPIVCAVNGVAAGAGANIALACDIVVAARSARFVQSFARLGLVPDSGGTYFLPRLIGEARAFELLITGRAITPDEALSIGLVSAIFPAEEAAQKVREVAERLAVGPGLAIANIKRAVREGIQESLDDGLALEAELVEELFRSQDATEGLTAFVEKRTPEFVGA